jgi:hypothetical protein
MGGRGKDHLAFGFQARDFPGPEIQSLLTAFAPRPTGHRGPPRPRRAGLGGGAKIIFQSMTRQGTPGAVVCNPSPKRGSTDFDSSGGEGWVSPFGDSLSWGRLGRGIPKGETKAGEGLSCLCTLPFPSAFGHWPVESLTPFPWVALLVYFLQVGHRHRRINLRRFQGRVAQ